MASLSIASAWAVRDGGTNTALITMPNFLQIVLPPIRSNLPIAANHAFQPTPLALLN